jgi:predicted Zn-dependent protease
LPGAKIGVHTGLLEVATNQDQLAVVIGHEVAHVLAQHSNERVSTGMATQLGLIAAQEALSAGVSFQSSQQAMALLGLGAQVGIVLPYSRTQESEADLLGLDLIARAGFDPAASVALWRNMARHAEAQRRKAGSSSDAPPEFLSTHPSHGTRISNLQQRIPKATKLRDEARAHGRRPNCQR